MLADDVLERQVEEVAQEDLRELHEQVVPLGLLQDPVEHSALLASLNLVYLLQTCLARRRLLGLLLARRIACRGLGRVAHLQIGHLFAAPCSGGRLLLSASIRHNHLLQQLLLAHARRRPRLAGLVRAGGLQLQRVRGRQADLVERRRKLPVQRGRGGGHLLASGLVPHELRGRLVGHWVATGSALGRVRARQQTLAGGPVAGRRMLVLEPAHLRLLEAGPEREHLLPVLIVQGVRQLIQQVLLLVVVVLVRMVLLMMMMMMQLVVEVAAELGRERPLV